VSELRRAFDTKKHNAVKEMKHREKSIFVSTSDIFDATAKYGQGEYWKFVRDKFRDKHGVEITDTEKLVFYTTLLDDTMKISGHTRYSITEPKE
jgi:hypothetical protein